MSHNGPRALRCWNQESQWNNSQFKAEVLRPGEAARVSSERLQDLEFRHQRARGEEHLPVPGECKSPFCSAQTPASCMAAVHAESGSFQFSLLINRPVSSRRSSQTPPEIVLCRESLIQSSSHLILIIAESKQ